MKRLSFLFCLFCTIAVMIGCAVAASSNSGGQKAPETEPETVDYSQMPSVGSTALTLFNPKSLHDLETEAKYIVTGKLLDDAQQYLINAPGANTVCYGYTISTMEITHVYKGDLSVGDKIPYAEEYYTYEQLGEDTLFYTNNYYPSDTGREYLFFMGRLPKKENSTISELYYPEGYELARYPIITKGARSASMTYSYSQLNLGHDSELYREIFSDVIDQYMS